MNACQRCGACCASLRVTFPVEEADRLGGCVPSGLTESYGNVLCMRTTAHGQCVALRGSIGIQASCSIYELRPSSCREFGALAILGRGDTACDDARRRCGLPPLDNVGVTQTTTKAN